MRQEIARILDERRNKVSYRQAAIREAAKREVRRVTPKPTLVVRNPEPEPIDMSAAANVRTTLVINRVLYEDIKFLAQEAGIATNPERWMAEAVEVRVAEKRLQFAKSMTGIGEGETLSQYLERQKREKQHVI